MTCAKRLSSQKHFNHCKILFFYDFCEKNDIPYWLSEMIHSKWSQGVYFWLGDRILHATLYYAFVIFVYCQNMWKPAVSTTHYHKVYILGVSDYSVRDLR